MIEPTVVAVCLMIFLVAACIGWLWTWFDLRDQRKNALAWQGHENTARAKLLEVINSADATIGRLREEITELQMQIEPLHAENERLIWQCQETKKLHNQALMSLATEQQRVEKVQEMLRASTASLEQEVNAHSATRTALTALQARAHAQAEEMRTW